MDMAWDLCYQCYAMVESVLDTVGWKQSNMLALWCASDEGMWCLIYLEVLPSSWKWGAKCVRKYIWSCEVSTAYKNFFTYKFRCVEVTKSALTLQNHEQLKLEQFPLCLSNSSCFHRGSAITWRNGWLKLETLVLSKVIRKIQGNLVSVEMVGIESAPSILWELPTCTIRPKWSWPNLILK